MQHVTLTLKALGMLGITLSGLKKFLIAYPGLERSDNPGVPMQHVTLTLKALGMLGITLSGLKKFLIAYPGLSLRSNPGLKLANAFGVLIPCRAFIAEISNRNLLLS